MEIRGSQSKIISRTNSRLGNRLAREIKQKQIDHADFAILAILLSYFENIAKFKAGYIKVGNESKSGYYFRKRLRLVFPKLINRQKSTLQELLYN